MKLNSKIFLKILFAFLAVIIISCNKNTDGIAPDSSGTPVTITNPQTINLTEYITLNATTVFQKKEIVRATFQGFIEKIYKSIGDRISNGDLLFEIKTKESAASDNLELKLSDGTFTGSIQIKARSNGVLTELNYNTGDFVSDGEQISVISNPTSLRINLNVPYQYTNKLSINKQCQIFLPNGKIINAFIQKIIPRVDPTAQTQTYILAMKQFDNLPENLNVNVCIPIINIKDATVVPVTSILNNETLDKFWIMKLLNDTTAVRVDVIKGIENDSLVQILNPKLNLSDRIITDGAFGIPDTAKVVVGK